MVIEEQASANLSNSSLTFGEVSELGSAVNLIRDVSNNSKHNQNWNAFKPPRAED